MTSISLVRTKAYCHRTEFWIMIIRIEISYKVSILEVFLTEGIMVVILEVVFLILTFEEEISVMVIRIMETGLITCSSTRDTLSANKISNNKSSLVEELQHHQHCFKTHLKMQDCILSRWTSTGTKIRTPTKEDLVIKAIETVDIIRITLHLIDTQAINNHMHLNNELIIVIWKKKILLQNSIKPTKMDSIMAQTGKAHKKVIMEIRIMVKAMMWWTIHQIKKTKRIRLLISDL